MDISPTTKNRLNVQSSLDSTQDKPIFMDSNQTTSQQFQ